MTLNRLDAQTFRAAETVFRAPYASFDFDVEQSDQGPACYHWPRCVALDPARGVALVHPQHPDGAWRLTLLDLTGRVVAKRPLAGIPGIGLDRDVMPRALGRTPAGDLLLLVSRGFDRVLRVASNFTVAALSETAIPIEHWNLPGDFQFFGTAFPMGERLLANLHLRPAPHAWRWYAPGDRDARFARASSGALAALVGTASTPVLVDATARDQAQLVRPGIEPRRVQWQAWCPQSGSPVHGQGRFFGMVDYPPRDPDLLGQGLLRTLTIMYLDLERSLAMEVVQTQLLPEHDNPDVTTFEVCLNGQCVIDAQGDYSELVWTPDALVLRRYPCDRARLHAKLEVREEERARRDIHPNEQ